MSPEQDELVKKRSIKIRNHATSVSLENAFWTALAELAREQGRTIAALVEEVDAERHAGNLSSCLRLYVLAKARQRYLAVTVAGHTPKSPEERPKPARRQRDTYEERGVRNYRKSRS